MTQAMNRRAFFKKTAQSAVAAVAAVAGATAIVKLDGMQPKLNANTSAARMGFNPRVCCPHMDQDNNPNHVCSFFCRIG